MAELADQLGQPVSQPAGHLGSDFAFFVFEFFESYIGFVDICHFQYFEYFDFFEFGVAPAPVSPDGQPASQPSRFRF